MTLETEVRIVLPGAPAPKGSLKCIGRNGRHQLVDQLKTTGTYAEKLAGIVRTKVKQRAEKGQAIGVELTVTVDRPPSHRRSGANVHLLRKGAPVHPIGRGTGDVDKVARNVLDALQAGGLLVDDAAVVDLTARQRYADLDAEPPYPGDVLPWAGIVLRVFPID